MTRKSGTADLPLHSGHVPKWLANRMTKLGAVACEAIIHHYGRDELLRRLSHPFWFQSLGAVMGMDWHSSGITTSVIGALKRGLKPLEKELGVYMCGGRGKHSRKTPEELAAIGNAVGFDGNALAKASRMVAKVDSAAVQDSFQLYLHGFVVTADGHWAVVQQGMNEGRRQARRYHWISEGLQNFVDQPHAAIDGPNQGNIINLTDHRAQASRSAQIEILSSLGPDQIVREWKILNPVINGKKPAKPAQEVTRRLHGNLAAAADRGPADFQELLMIPGIGERTVRALSLVAEVLHGAPCRFSDPARFSLAHGGKDRHPFPVPVHVYDQTIRVLKSAVCKAKLGQDEELAAIRRLDEQARALEQYVSGPSAEAFMADERIRSHEYGGRSVFGLEKPASDADRKKVL